MTMKAKPIVTLWSKAAITAVDDALAKTQRTVRFECSEIVEDARSWFMHVVHLEGGNAYLCTGSDEGEVWQVRVQLAEFEPMGPLRDDHPDPQSRGRVLQMPRAVDEDDNDVFVELGYLEH
ncbi:MAG: hypothetical protein EOP22_03515 [Hyphomicrobiales bacterium]|nr:MAG: hypothetical protein EOP22_03515 [Hyphomicrobiales bacterium]